MPPNLSCWSNCSEFIGLYRYGMILCPSTGSSNYVIFLLHHEINLLIDADL
jgi:hypothetical protein